MSNTVSFVAALLVGVLVGGATVALLPADDDCYTEAIAIAESATDTTDALADNVFESIERILMGLPPDEAELARIADQHEANQEDVEALEETCG